MAQQPKKFPKLIAGKPGNPGELGKPGTKSSVVSFERGTLAHIFEVACANAFVGNDSPLSVEYRGLCASSP
jgi:hypothetical protein